MSLGMTVTCLHRSAEYSDDCHDRSACSYPSTCSSLSKEQVLSPRLSFSVQSTESSHEWPSHLVGSHTRSSWQNPVVSNLGLDHHSHSDIRDEHSTTQCGLSSVLHILPPLRRNQLKQWVTYNSTHTIYGTRSIDNTHTHTLVHVQNRNIRCMTYLTIPTLTHSPRQEVVHAIITSALGT